MTTHLHPHHRPGYAAAGWAGLYGVLALLWTLTGDGYPFGPNDPGGQLSLLRPVPADVGAPVLAGLALVTSVVMLAMAGPHAVRLSGVPRLLLLGYGWLVAAALLIVAPDGQVLAVAGYAPMLILSLPFGGLPVDYATVFTWSLLNKMLAVAGGLLVARTVLGWQRRTADRCVACGRGGPVSWTAPDRAARWGRWATWVAAAVPLVYALSRLAWLAGVPLGISADLLRELRDSGGVWAGAGLAAFAVVGAVLTLGLVRPWGERFPRWLPGLAGRPVPANLAVVPATLVAVAVGAASLGFLANPELARLIGAGDGAVAPMLLWPLWSVALAVAAYAYHLRRRGTCPRCKER
ncbi:hypothetical protein [Micromonospora echinofusca]|uniref:Uncharacterized protein n=1 Tax=Micromonospora echinofusca TaxID=47858 RepID=A0ABS3VXM7_MICEH|nr:hypothetical protein [Micromonospora echinofusca]MBO4209258.1 hypothetical protein [Micromonospora echinofusca]